MWCVYCSATGEVRDEKVHRWLRPQPGENVHVPSDHGIGNSQFRDIGHRRIRARRKNKSQKAMFSFFFYTRADWWHLSNVFQKSCNLEMNMRWADVFILVYSITDKCSFDDCSRLKFLINYNKKKRRLSAKVSRIIRWKPFLADPEISEILL